MARIPNSQEPVNGFDELQMMTKSIGLLAVLTGIVYLRVIGAESLLALQSDDQGQSVLVLFALLIVAILGLLFAWRQEGVGGFVAALSAVGIGIFAFLSFQENRWFAAFAYSSPFLITGLMFVTCWWRKRL
ncbi:MAG: hypothetical protein R3E31_28790 [Chloroflexota bacterium]|nr:hypothetical protein [Anaerolineales bacterium]MCB8968815.1 hypothetical protein [Ardenticatenaceae bacterium]